MRPMLPMALMRWSGELSCRALRYTDGGQAAVPVTAAVQIFDLRIVLAALSPIGSADYKAEKAL